MSSPHCWVLYGPGGYLSGRFLTEGLANAANKDRFERLGQVVECNHERTFLA